MPTTYTRSINYLSRLYINSKFGITLLNRNQTKLFIDLSFFISIGVTNIRNKDKVLQGCKGTFWRDDIGGKTRFYTPRRLTHKSGGINWYLLGDESGFSLKRYSQSRSLQNGRNWTTFFNLFLYQRKLTISDNYLPHWCTRNGSCKLNIS